MKRILVYASPLALAVAIAVGMASSHALAQQAAGRSAQAAGAGKATDKAQTARGSADQDPNVKVATGVNDPAKDMPAPARKGGQKTRGMACYVNFDNYTPWYVEAFVDGTYRGTVAPYGDLDTVTGDGPTTIYARARFTDGSMKYWGPRTGNCVNDSFVWSLYR